jgi:heme/copper-type cytochrome/quinol oxidase subunit 3
MGIFIFTEIMLFAGFISAFVIVKARAAGGVWPPLGQPRLPVEETAINTTALILSAIVLLLAGRMFRKNPASAKLPLLGAMGLGLFFVIGQGMEWAALLSDGLTLTSSAHGAFFYTIVGFHGLHAVVAIGMLVWAFVKLVQEKLTITALWTCQTFWYFVVGLWPVIYWKVYLG